MKIVTFLGTRPEIIKLSPLIPLLDKNFSHILIHTGQHFSPNMDRVFFKDLQLRQPDLRLYSGKRPQDFFSIFSRCLSVMKKIQPKYVLVQGDTNSSAAGALAAHFYEVPIIHVEAGCRSFDLRAPEETNRRVIDFLASLTFAPDKIAMANLRQERHPSIYLVGNTGLVACKRAKTLLPKIKREKHLLVTFHRSENTNARTLRSLLKALNQLSREHQIIWLLHPRTEKILKRANLKIPDTITVLPPQAYMQTLSLIKSSLCVLSDSGGIQEECAVLNRPCFILRKKTEWHRLVKEGKNFLVGTKSSEIVAKVSLYANNPKLQKEVACKKASLPFGASKKIIKVLKSVCSKSS